MLKFSSLLITSIVLFSCSSIKEIDKNTYQEFRTQQKSFSSADGNIKYVDKGKSDEVLLLLHGVPSSSWLYRKMIPLLVAKGYRIIAPDMLGFGASDNPDGYELYSEKQHAKRIITLMNSLNIDHWHHVTHDAGGLWTWEILKQAPDKITKLTVLNSIVYEEGFHPPIRMKKGFFAKTAMWMYNNGITTSKMLKMLFKEGVKDPNTLSKSDIYGYKKPLLENKTKGMYYFFTQTCNSFPNYHATFSHLKIPTQFVWGTHDKMLRIDSQLQQIKKGFKVTDNAIHLIDAKHFIQEEKPEEIVKFITEL